MGDNIRMFVFAQVKPDSHSAGVRRRVCVRDSREACGGGKADCEGGGGEGEVGGF